MMMKHLKRFNGKENAVELTVLITIFNIFIKSISSKIWIICSYIAQYRFHFSCTQKVFCM